MAQLKQDATVNFINAIISHAQALRSIKNGIDDLVNLYNKEGFSTVWNAMKTCAVNTDGSLGAADGTPVLTNPIDTRVAGQTLISKDVTATMLTNYVAALQQLQNFFGNAAVTTGDRLQVVDDLAL